MYNIGTINGEEFFLVSAAIKQIINERNLVDIPFYKK